MHRRGSQPDGAAKPLCFYKYRAVRCLWLEEKHSEPVLSQGYKKKGMFVRPWKNKKMKKQNLSCTRRNHARKHDKLYPGNYPGGFAKDSVTFSDFHFCPQETPEHGIMWSRVTVQLQAAFFCFITIWALYSSELQLPIQFCNSKSPVILQIILTLLLGKRDF